MSTARDRASSALSLTAAVLAALCASSASAQIPGPSGPVDTPAPPEDVGPQTSPAPAPPAREAREVTLQRGPGHDVVWRDEWPRFQTWQYVLTGVQAGAAVGSLWIPSGGGRLSLSNEFDRTARSALRADSYDGYLLARDVSDVGIVLLINHRIADSAFVTWWGYGKGSVAWEMAMIDLQTVSFTAAVNGLVAGIAARERPYGDRQCLTPDGADSSDCQGSKRYRSFFSGHSSTAFALAGLTCMHHAHIPLYGHPVADGAACVSALGLAGTVAMMRVVSDQHWTSDILVGSGFGLVSGLSIPWIFHYSGGGKAAPTEAAGPSSRPPFTWSLTPTPGGVGVSGVF